MTRLLVLALLFAAPDDEFAGLTWVDAKPEFQGKVTLVRWWTNG